MWEVWKVQELDHEEFPSWHLQSPVPHLSDIPCCDFLTQYQLIQAAGMQGSLRALSVPRQGAVLGSHLVALTEQLLALLLIHTQDFLYGAVSRV